MTLTALSPEQQPVYSHENMSQMDFPPSRRVQNVLTADCVILCYSDLFGFLNLTCWAAVWGCGHWAQGSSYTMEYPTADRDNYFVTNFYAGIWTHIP